MDGGEAAAAFMMEEAFQVREKKINAIQDRSTYITFSLLAYVTYAMYACTLTCNFLLKQSNFFQGNPFLDQLFGGGGAGRLFGGGGPMMGPGGSIVIQGPSTRYANYENTILLLYCYVLSSNLASTLL